MAIIPRMILLLFLLIITHAYSDYIQSSDGEFVQCIDKYKQPAFDHILLKNHKLQESPSEIPKSLIKIESKRHTLEAHVSTANCPKGTIPIRRQDQSTNTTELDTDYDYDPINQHEYASKGTRTPTKLYGTKATISVWKPKVEEGVDEFSVSQIWITSGDDPEINTIEVGWEVYPQFYMDSKPRLFISWTGDGYNKTGCNNLRCPGFIQTSSSIVLGGLITPISTVGGNQYEITLFVWKDQKHGNWWLSLGSENVLVGYWPAEIFNKLGDYADSIGWGGEIINTRKFDRHTITDMGSGRFPDEGFGKASYFRNLEIVDNNNSLKSVIDFNVGSDHPKFYDIKNFLTDDWGNHFFYGGPGWRSNSRAVGSTFFLSFFSFVCYGFLFII